MAEMVADVVGYKGEIRWDNDPRQERHGSQS
jgi:hypothetical protein